MRASSLSNKQVIDLLTKYFVPVYVAKDDSRQIQPSQPDQDELLRIGRACRQQQLDAGTVCVYIVHPDGTMLATQLVQKASKPEHLIPLLKQVIEKEQVTARDPKTVRVAAARKPVTAKSDDGVMLHVLTRFEGNRASYGLSEDWVELAPDEWRSLVPKEGLKTGASWQVPEKVAEKLFRYFYPPGPNWDSRQSSVTKANLSATLAAMSVQGTEITLRGSVELSYPFAGAGTDGKVTAKLVGVVRYNPQKRQLLSLAMVAEEAQFVWMWQGKPQPEKMAIAVEMEQR